MTKQNTTGSNGQDNTYINPAVDELCVGQNSNGKYLEKDLTIAEMYHQYEA